jgi:AraC family transcriptional activator of pobA
MHKKTKSIPINSKADNISQGISIEKAFFKDLPNFEEAKQSHREECHSFFLLENGTVSVVIDFEKYKIKSPSITYMNPNQVHQIIALENATISNWAINNENLNPEYLKLLEEITPAKPMLLKKETFSIISEAISLCIKISERKHEKLYHSLLKDSFNALVALVVSQYLEQLKSTDKLSRFDIVTKAFKELLERNFTTIKSPTEYALKLSITTSYLNECVKNTTGFSVSHHIQQRIILEAKRILYHSDKSVKKIATDLGFDDYPYFSRLFTKVAGMTALAFRNKNHD